MVEATAPFIIYAGKDRTHHRDARPFYCAFRLIRALLIYAMASTRKTQPRTFSFRDLTVWRTRLPDVKFAVLPPSNTRPNPLATQDRLYASVFAPGAICALERDRGKLIWRRELPKYAHSSVYIHEGKLFATTANALFALHPDSGEALWSFCPYGTDGESIYSSPSAHENRVYIGDRRGYLHCLDTESGKTIWRRRTNKARNDDVNSTPLLLHGLVIVSTNAKTVIAYQALSGKLAWKQELDGSSTFGPLVHRNSVLALSNSLYLLNSKTGSVQRRFSWRDEKVQEADSTPRSIVLTFWPRLAASSTEPSGKMEPYKMTVITKSGVQRTTTLVASCPCFRYASPARLVYLSHLHGIDLFHPETGAVVCRLKARNDMRNGIAPVDVKDAKIYALAGDGSVYALRHPT